MTLLIVTLCCFLFLLGLLLGWLMGDSAAPTIMAAIGIISGLVAAAGLLVCVVLIVSRGIMAYAYEDTAPQTRQVTPELLKK